MNKILIAYFSHRGENYVAGRLVELPVGNTERVAEMIARHTGGDLFRIERTTPYPATYKACVAEAVRELREQVRPPLTARVDHMDAYDTVFVGYPNWCGTMPRPVFTFLRSHDFSGKRIFPFCTSGGSGLGSSISDIKATAPGADVSEGFHSSGHADDEDLIRWIESLS